MGFLLDRAALTAAAHGGILGEAARGQASSAVTPQGGLVGGGGGEGGGGGAYGEGEDGRWRGEADVMELDLRFLMVAFSAAVNTTPTERIQDVGSSVRVLCSVCPTEYTIAINR